LDTILLSGDARGAETPVRLFEGDREDRRPGLQQAGITRDVTEHLAFRVDYELAFLILEFDLDGLSAGSRRDAGDGSVRHRAVGYRVPGGLALGDTARRLGSNAQFDAMQFTVRTLDPGREDVVVRLDVGGGLLRQRRNCEIIRERYCRRLAV